MSNSELAVLKSEFRPVASSRDGIKTLVIAFRRAMPDTRVMTQEQVALAIGMPRATLAAMLDPDRVPKTESIPLSNYENLRRALQPTLPGGSEPLSLMGMVDLLLKEQEVDSLAIVPKSQLGIEIEKQIKRNMLREGGRPYQECEAELVRILQILPRDGESMANGTLSEDEARTRLIDMKAGRYTPTSELETAMLAAWLECDEKGHHDQRWVKWICGLMPVNYVWTSSRDGGSSGS